MEGELKTKKVVLHTGDVVTVKQKTMASELKLMFLPQITGWDVIRVSVDDASLDVLEKTPFSKEDMRLILDAVAEMNKKEFVGDAEKK